MSRLLSRVFRGTVYLPKTLYINFRTLPFSKAVKLPYIVMGPCKFRGVKKKNVRIEGEIKTGMIRLAAQKTAKRGIHVNRKAYLVVDNGGSITFKGSASIGAGTSFCAHGGDITVGDKFSCNVNCFFYSMKSIEIGNRALMGWNINVRDNDGHPLFQDGKLINPHKSVKLGDRIWIASYVDVMKGVTLANGTVIGTRSLVTRSVEQENTLIAGIPAKMIKENVTWEQEFPEEYKGTKE